MQRVTKRGIRVGGDEVFVYRVAPPVEVGERRGLILAPPWIGGSGLQQYLYFKVANRAGYELALFDYRGHARSSGRFSFRRSFREADEVVRHLREETGGERIIGMAGCYGALPLLRAAQRRPEAFEALCLYSPVPDLKHVSGPLDVLSRYYTCDGRFTPRNPFALRAILAETMKDLFPGVSSSRDHFGILRWEKASMASLLFDYLLSDPLASVHVEGVPALVVYSTADELLRLDDAAREERYRARFERVLPGVELRVTADADHFWTGVGDDAIRSGLEFVSALRAKAAAGRERERRETNDPEPHPPIPTTPEQAVSRAS